MWVAVDDAPAFAERAVAQQPLDGAEFRPREAVVDFLGLLGGVDVDRGRPVDAVETVDEPAQRLRRYGAKRMRCRAEADFGVGSVLGGERRDHGEDVVGVGDEPPLSRRRRRAAEPAGAIERR
jgi:hypothetical protein